MPRRSSARTSTALKVASSSTTRVMSFIARF
jgi:hypothetical protein